MSKVYNTNFVNGVGSGCIEVLARELMCNLSDEEVKHLSYICFGTVKDSFNQSEVDTMMDVFCNFINDIYEDLMGEIAEHLAEEANL